MNFDPQIPKQENLYNEPSPKANERKLVKVMASKFLRSYSRISHAKYSDEFIVLCWGEVLTLC